MIGKQRYENGRILGAGRLIEDLELVRCEFIASHVAQHDDPNFSVVVRNVTATRCVAKRSGVSGVRFEDVLVDGLSCTLTHFSGCVFKRVTRRDRIGRVMFTPTNPTLPADTREATEHRGNSAATRGGACISLHIGFIFAE